MLPALTTRPKQAVRQVQGLTNDSIDAYANTPPGHSGNVGDASFADNSESDVGISRASPPTTSRTAATHPNSARTMIMKKPADADDGREGVLARVMRDRKATGDEDLSLRTGDVVRVLSPKRSGYLKCEFADQIGYVPSSYLEFFDDAAAAASGVGDGSSTARDGGENLETSRPEKRKKKKKRDKEKRRKDKGDNVSDGEEVAESPTRSQQKATPRAAVGEDGHGTGRGASESPRKSKKKHRKYRRDDDGELVDEEPLSSRRGGGDKDLDDDSGESIKHSSRRREKKRRDRQSSESSESDDDGGSHTRRGKKARRRRHRRSDSYSNSSQDEGSDASYRRRRRRRHRRSSSEEEDYDSDQKRWSPRRSRKNRARGSDGSDVEQNDAGSRPARKHNKKRRDVDGADAGESLASPADNKQGGGDTQVKETEKAMARLDIQDKAARTATVKGEEGSQKSEVSDHVNETSSEFNSGSTATKAGSMSKEAAGKGNNDSSSRSKAKDSTRKDDESRTESTASAAVQKSGKSTLGKQIGDKMRSFLGGGKKNERSSKNSSGILNACPGTVQGEEGWYEHGENERYYFILVDGKWSLLYGPMTEDDFESYSAKVTEQSRMMELPPTYLHKTGYYLNREMRVQRV